MILTFGCLPDSGWFRGILQALKSVILTVEGPQDLCMVEGHSAGPITCDTNPWVSPRFWGGSGSLRLKDGDFSYIDLKFY